MYIIYVVNTYCLNTRLLFPQQQPGYITGKYPLSHIDKSSVVVMDILSIYCRSDQSCIISMVAMRVVADNHTLTLMLGMVWLSALTD